MGTKDAKDLPGIGCRARMGVRAPLVIGSLADTRGFGAAFTLTAAAFLVAAVIWLGLPETKGRQLA